MPVYEKNDLRHLRNELGIQETDKVIILGSTRRGEEEQLLEAFLESNEQRSDLKLILVPRQLDRVNEVEKICRDYSFAVQKKTNLSPNTEWKVLIIDTMGELAQLYALSNIAFVGGSLVPWGGHNILEPAYYEKPIFFGPHMNNFAFFADKFIQNEAARVINNKKDLVNMFLDVDKKHLIDMGKRAKETLSSLKGATEKTLKTIEAFIGR